MMFNSILCRYHEIATKGNNRIMFERCLVDNIHCLFKKAGFDYPVRRVRGRIWIEKKDGELFALGVHISPYEKGNIYNREPLRPKKLLMHKREIIRLFSKVKEDGLTLVPLALYFSGSHVKVELGLCKGKKLYVKRETDAKRQASRDIDRAMKDRY